MNEDQLIKWLRAIGFQRADKPGLVFVRLRSKEQLRHRDPLLGQFLNQITLEGKKNADQ